MKPNRELQLMAVLTGAVTYSFRTSGSAWTAWALCTVNDDTGELIITSDYGNWSYRWNPSPESLGHPTLTAFIGDRGDVDYIARKLQNEGRNGQKFSAKSTTAALRRVLCAARLRHGRERFATPILFLTREEARRIWDEIGEVADETWSDVMFIDHLSRIDGFFDYVTDEPWNYLETEQTPEDKALRELVLPALMAACRERLVTGGGDAKTVV